MRIVKALTFWSLKSLSNANYGSFLFLSLKALSKQASHISWHIVIIAQKTSSPSTKAYHLHTFTRIYCIYTYTYICINNSDHIVFT